MVCKNCGCKIQNGFTNCPKCGTKYEEEKLKLPKRRINGSYIIPRLDEIVKKHFYYATQTPDKEVETRIGEYIYGSTYGRVFALYSNASEQFGLRFEGYTTEIKKWMENDKSFSQFKYYSSPDIFDDFIEMPLPWSDNVELIVESISRMLIEHFRESINTCPSYVITRGPHYYYRNDGTRYSYNMQPDVIDWGESVTVKVGRPEGIPTSQIALTDEDILKAKKILRIQRIIAVALVILSNAVDVFYGGWFFFSCIPALWAFLTDPKDESDKDAMRYFWYILIVVALIVFIWGPLSQ